MSFVLAVSCFLTEAHGGGPSLHTYHLYPSQHGLLVSALLGILSGASTAAAKSRNRQALSTSGHFDELLDTATSLVLARPSHLYGSSLASRFFGVFNSFLTYPSQILSLCCFARLLSAS